MADQSKLTQFFPETEPRKVRVRMPSPTRQKTRVNLEIKKEKIAQERRKLALQNRIKFWTWKNTKLRQGKKAEWSKAGISRVIKQEAGISRAIKQEPGTSRAIKQEPGTSRAIKREPGTSRAIKQEPGTSRAIKREPGTSRAIKQEPGTSRAIKQEPGTSRVIKQEPGTSRVIEQEPGGGATVKYEKTGDLNILRNFDLNMEFGPCTNITRLERWNRAEKLELDPPTDVKQLIESHLYDKDYTQNTWANYNI